MKGATIMSDDKKSVTIKTILDKTGITKGIKEVQSWLKRNPIRITAGIDTRSAEKELKTASDRIAKQTTQNVKIPSAATEIPREQKLSVSGASGQRSTQSSTPDSKVSSNPDLSILAGPILDNVKKSLTELASLTKKLDEIRAISNLTGTELQELGDTAYETAGKYGKNIGDYLSSVREMADSGYENAGQLGELSTMLQSAKGFSSELADTYITAADAAYGYGGNIEKLTALLDGQNQITNKNSISMKEMANAVQAASSETPSGFHSISEDEMSALLGTGLETSGKSGEEVGKTVGNILENLEELSGSNDLRDPIEQLKEYSEAYNALPENDPEKTGILSGIGKGTDTDVFSGILENWNIYEKMLDDYGNSSGSVMSDAMTSADSLSGRLNELENAWLGFISNLSDSSELSVAVDMLNGLVGIVDDLTSLSTLGTLGALSGLLMNKSGIGGRTMFQW